MVKSMLPTMDHYDYGLQPGGGHTTGQGCRCGGSSGQAGQPEHVVQQGILEGPVGENIDVVVEADELRGLRVVKAKAERIDGRIDEVDADEEKSGQ